MDRKWLLLGFAIVIAGGLVAAPYLLPKQTVTLDEDAPDAMDGDGMMDDTKGDGMDAMRTTHRSAAWQDGDPGHRASGSVSIVTVDGAPYLHFEDFEMTAGPDVYIYLTSKADARSTSDVEGDGVRIDASTDADPDARINERGTFFIPLEMSVEEAEAYAGIVAWCDDFNVVFGSGAFSDA